MNPRDMVSQLIALLGDPGAEKIPEPLALRLLNDAQETIANMIHPFYPALFRTVTTDSGDGSTVIFTIPSACALLEKVAIDSSADVEMDAIRVPLEDWGATASNQFYTGAVKEGQIFYTHRGDNKIEFSPAPPTGKPIWFYYRKKPITMGYDYGKANIALNGTYVLTDPTKDWPVSIWKTTRNPSFLLQPTEDIANEIVITSNTSTTITIANTETVVTGIKEYEVYTPTNIPEKFHSLIVKQALASQDGGRAEQLKSEIKEEFMMLAGGR